MSSTTISAMIMEAADGDLNYLNSTPIGSFLLDDMGLDEDDFQLSQFEVYIPESYDSKFMTDYEYISKNAQKFIQCTSREYAIQGELLKFFVIVRPPEDSKKKQKQQQIQQHIQRKQQQQLINQSNTSTPPPTQPIKVISSSDSPKLIVSDIDAKTNETIDLNNNNNNNNTTTPPTSSPSNNSNNNNIDNISILFPSSTSSQNLIFELQLRLATDYEKSTKDNQNPLNIIDYNPKHTFVNTEMKNDHISSSKSATSYLRQNTLSVNSNAINSNNNSNNSSNNRFIGDLVEVSSPFTFKDTSLSYQKPNFFRLSNGDIVFPIESPIYIREINEDKLITMVIKVNRPKNNRNNAHSSDNKLERLIQGGIDRSLSSIRSSLSSSSGQNQLNNKNTRTILKNFTLVQPLKVCLQPQISGSSSIPIGNRNLIAVTLENTHSTLPLKILNLDVYLFHVLNMESITLIDSVQGQTSVPTHRQLGNLVKVNEHYIIKNLSGNELPITLEPSNQYSMVLSVEPTSVQKVLQPMDGFHTKIKVSWEIPSSSGQILSLYELKVNPPFTTDLMISTDNKSPVVINEKFLVKFNISNLSNSLKNLTINIPPPIIKNNGITANVGKVTQNSTASAGQSSDSSTANGNSAATMKKQNSSSSLNKSTTKLTNPNSGNTIGNSSNNLNRYIPVESHIHFSELSNKSLLSFDEVQRNSVNILCLEKSVHIGPVESKNSISASIEFMPLSTGIFEIQNITLYDSIEKKSYQLKEPFQICCVSQLA